MKMTQDQALKEARRDVFDMRHERAYGVTNNYFECAKHNMRKAGLDPDTDEAWQKMGLKNGLRTLAVVLRQGNLRDARKNVQDLYDRNTSTPRGSYELACYYLRKAGLDPNSDRAWKKAGVPAGLEGIQALVQGLEKELQPKRAGKVWKSDDLSGEFYRAAHSTSPTISADVKKNVSPAPEAPSKLESVTPEKALYTPFRFPELTLR